LHPDNFGKGEAIAHECNGLGYGGVKIIREMHRKIKTSLEFLALLFQDKRVKKVILMQEWNLALKQKDK